MSNLVLVNKQNPDLRLPIESICRESGTLYYFYESGRNSPTMASKQYWTVKKRRRKMTELTKFEKFIVWSQIVLAIIINFVLFGAGLYKIMLSVFV